VIELMILGFLAEGPQHGYELRRRMAQLHGYARPISDGTVYPAINRLIAAGAVTEADEPGARAASRRTLTLTAEGRTRLLDRLRTASGHDITDGSRFIVVLAFLSLLPDETDRDAVLRRRLDFLDQPASFFYEGRTPLKAKDIDDPYRRGILLSARATSRAERAWIRELLDSEKGHKT
jgi:DNA-binding PadR family transcriptional regulator